MYDKPFHSGDLKKYSFLITGGAGFIGSHIVQYLVKYNAGRIRVMDNLATGSLENIQEYIDKGKVEFYNGDIVNFEDCLNAASGIDFVSHQAALGSVPRSIEFPLATHRTNVDGFVNMLLASRQKGCKRFVYASSSSVYGDHPALPKKEENIGNALSPYAASKKADELYAEVYHKVYGTEVIGLRYFNIFGPRQSPSGPYAAAIPLFMEALLNNRSPVIYGDGTQTRDFTFVENAVQANIKAIFAENREALGQVFNIAFGERTSVNDLFNILKKETGATAGADFKPLRKGDIPDSLADISKAQTLLNYNPKINFEEGLKKTFVWFKASLKS